MTTYIVLRYDNDCNAWEKEGQADASSPTRAIRLLETGPGIFVAVPARSWKELTVKVEQTTKVTIG